MRGGKGSNPAGEVLRFLLVYLSGEEGLVGGRWPPKTEEERPFTAVASVSFLIPTIWGRDGGDEGLFASVCSRGTVRPPRFGEAHAASERAAVRQFAAFCGQPLNSVSSLYIIPWLS